MSILRRFYRRSRHAVSTALGKDIQFPTQIQIPAERHGNDYGGWYIAAGKLSPASVIYSFGIGEDTSFDLSLIDKYGAAVHAFDPTPGSIAWVKSQSLPSRFVLHETGIAACDGQATFFPPENPAHISHTMIDRPSTKARAISVEVRRLATLMRELGHQHIDLLKMDIEGAEYAVLDDVLQSAIPIGQILVEFHHRFDGVGVAATRQAVASLNAAGYQIFSASESGEEYSFITDRPVRGSA